MLTHSILNNQRLRTLAMIIGLALLYATLALLSLRSEAVQGQGLIPPLWLAAGLALAALVLGGRPLLFGVFFGALASYLGALGSLHAVPLAISLALSTALQAWLGALLLRRYVGELPPPTVAGVWHAIALLAPVAALSPLLGLLSLGLAGLVSWRQTPELAWQWWLSVYAGMLIAAPILIVVGQILRRRTLREPLIWPLAGLMLGLTLLGFLLTWQEQERRLMARLETDTAAIANLLKDSLTAQQYALAAVHAFFTASQQVDRAEFTRFTLPLIEAAPPLKAIAWAPYVPATQRVAFEQAQRAQGPADFTIFELDAYGERRPVTARPAFFPVTFFEPAMPNQIALGFDLGSEAVRLQTLEYARDRGAATLSPPLRLIDMPAPQRDLLLVSPLYQTTSPPESLTQRRTQLVGLVVGVIEAEHLLDYVVSDGAGARLDLYLFDLSEAQPYALSSHYTHPAALALPSNGDLRLLTEDRHTMVELDLYGRTWLLIARPGPAYLAETQLWLAWARLATGVLATVFFLLFIDMRQRGEAQLSASERRSQTLLKAMPDMMFRVSREGRILDYSGAEGMQLYVPPSAFIGQPIAAVLPPEVAAQALAAINQALASGALQSFEYQMGSGNLVCFYETRVSANRGEVEAVAIVRDISAARRALAEITQLSRVVEQMDDVVIITDVQWDIQYVNPAFERRIGYSRAEVLGRSASILKSGVEDPALYEQLWKDILIGVSFQAEICHRHKDGRLIYVATTITPLRNEHGSISHFVATGKDMTARKQIEHDLQERLKELTCLRQVQRLVERDLELDELGTQVVAALVVAMQYPDDTVALLELDGQRYGEAFDVPPVRQLSAAIIAGGIVCGRLSVTYRTEGHGFLMPEEQNLIDGIAHSLGLWLERRQGEQALTRERNLLAQRVAERTADLSRANLDLSRAVRAKDDFLANMSHELRTPLNAILALSESLLEGIRGPLNERQAASLTHIESSGRHLLTLINDILDLSKIEAGRLEIQREQVSIADVCAASLVFVRELASKKQIQLSFRLNDQLALLNADPKRLKQILVNLLSNAVKFTHPGGAVSLAVAVEPAERLVRFTVRDTGIGIAPEDLARLFRPFVQLDSSLSREHEGTGLGLALVQRLTEIHGGSLMVESVPGQGSSFMVTLPWAPAMKFVAVDAAELHSATLSVATIPAALDAELAAPRVRILLVEDNELNIAATGDYLQDRGFTVVVAHNGREALDLVDAACPEVILMDIQMPVMDGLEATRRLRALPTYATTPIIALTALAMPGDRERCIAAGANLYLTKPISLRHLVESIESLL